MSEIMVAGQLAKLEITHATLADIAQHVANRITKSHVIGINLIDIDSILDMNEQYRHKSKPTNVLSFVYPTMSIEPYYDQKPDVYGEIFLCDDVIIREAKVQKKSIKAHTLHMFLHGILHIHGFDHESAKDAEEMEALEKKILQQFDIKDPYEENH